ncbi:MAG: hypothetical protein ABJA82_00460 [Myxococcales bacterium]
MTRGTAIGYRYWTADEEALLRERYLLDKPEDLAARMGRTRNCIMQKASVLGIATIRKPWPAADIRTLRNLWLEGDLSLIAKRLNRSKGSIYDRGRRMGLATGCPSGFEYLYAAAVRTGYHVSQMRMILKWAGVRIRRAMVCPSRPVANKHERHIVEPFDVDEAVKNWLATEPFAAAVRSRGIPRREMARRLRLVPGVPPKPEGKRHWRIPTEVIDQALALPLPAVRRAA